VKSIEPILGVLGAFFYSLHMPYYQGHLNTLWDRARTGVLPGPPVQGGPPAMPPPPS